MANNLTEEQISKIKARKIRAGVETATSIVASATLGGTVGYVGELSLQGIKQSMAANRNEKIETVMRDNSITEEERAKKIESIKKTGAILDKVTTIGGRALTFVGSYCVGHMIGQHVNTIQREKNYDIAKIVNSGKGKEPKETK